MMTHLILSRIPLLRKMVDERFLEHRRRSSSTAGFATLIVACALFDYRLIAGHVISWDLVIVMGTFGVIKTSLCFWYARVD